MAYNPNRKPPGSAGGTGGQFDVGHRHASASGASFQTFPDLDAQIHVLATRLNFKPFEVTTADDLYAQSREELDNVRALAMESIAYELKGRTDDDLAHLVEARKRF